MNRALYFEWYCRFQKERTSTDENPRNGRPITSTDNNHIYAIRDFVRQNHSLIISERLLKMWVSVLNRAKQF